MSRRSALSVWHAVALIFALGACVIGGDPTLGKACDPPNHPCISGERCSASGFCTVGGTGGGGGDGVGGEGGGSKGGGASMGGGTAQGGGGGGGTEVCGSTTCPTGCCSSGSCHTLHSNPADRCTSAGVASACIDCGNRADSCPSATQGCSCGGAPSCGSGQVCSAGHCFDAGTGACGACAGCCASDAGCVALDETSSLQCGSKGQSCFECGGSCFNGICNN